MSGSKQTKKQGFISKAKQKVKKSFDVFKTNKHENQYAKLGKFLESQDNDDEEEDYNDLESMGYENAEVISIDSDEDEGPSRKKIKRDVILVDDYSDDDNNEKTPIVADRPIKDHNELTDNTDFISLKFSDSDASDSEDSNEEDAYSMDDELTRIETNKPMSKSLNPWIKDHDHSTQKEICDWLTYEIRDFVAYISPSKEEIESRNQAVRRLRESITKFWTDCEVHVFGSYATDLYLPGSDIDMVITSPKQHYENRQALYSLANYLKKQKLATNVEVIVHTKVPIIKFVESKSNIHIDVSFERTNGIEAAKIIRGWINEVPALREMVLLIKQFLSIRKLNNVRLGGLGGYSTICMIYSFLKLHPRLSTNTIDANENLGVLLIEFFELYGRDFGYDNVALCVDIDNVCYLNKKYYPALRNDKNSFSISIQDPSDHSNNISRGSFNIRDIKKGFFGAYKLLTTKCYELENMTYKERLGQSILGNIIKYKGSERDFSDERSLVVNEALDDDSASIVSKIVYSGASSDDEEEEAKHKEIKAKEMTQDKKGSNRGRDDGKKVDDFMGLPEDTDEEEEKKKQKETLKLKRQNSVDKDTKRDYWLQKGNTLSN